MQLTRRRVLGGGVLLLAAWVTAHGIGHRPVGGVESPFLGSSNQRTLEAALEVLLPPAADPVAFARGVDRALADGDPLLGAGLRVALQVLEHAGGAGILQVRRFSRLSVEERAAVLERWRLSRIGAKRQIYQALRAVAVFAWYCSPGSWEAIGYDGPTVGR